MTTERCTICRLPADRRAAIDAAQAAAAEAADPDAAILALAERHRVSRLALQRHRSHVQGAPQRASAPAPKPTAPTRGPHVEPPESETEPRPDALPASSLERVGLMADRALRNAIDAANDPAITPSALREIQAEARQWETLRAKIRGDGAKVPPLHEHPDYVPFVELVLEAVDGFAGAAERLLEVLRARKAEAAAKELAA